MEDYEASGSYTMSGTEDEFNIVLNFGLILTKVPAILEELKIDSAYYGGQVWFEIFYDREEGMAGDGCWIKFTAHRCLNPSYDNACNALLGHKLAGVINPTDDKQFEEFGKHLHSTERHKIDDTAAKQLATRLIYGMTFH